MQERWGIAVRTQPDWSSLCTQRFPGCHLLGGRLPESQPGSSGQPAPPAWLRDHRSPGPPCPSTAAAGDATVCLAPTGRDESNSFCCLLTGSHGKGEICQNVQIRWAPLHCCKEPACALPSSSLPRQQERSGAVELLL